MIYSYLKGSAFATAKINAKGCLSCEDYISKGKRLDLKAKPPTLNFVQCPPPPIPTPGPTFRSAHSLWFKLTNIAIIHSSPFCFGFGFVGFLPVLVRVSNPRARFKRSQQTINHKIVIVKSRLESIDYIVLPVFQVLS